MDGGERQMRRMSGITVQVDERWMPSGAAKAPRQKRTVKTASRRPHWRWPGALRSAMVRRLALALSLLILALVAVALFPGKRVMGQMLAWSGRAGFHVDDIFVEGRAKTPRDQLLAALGVTRGDAIFAVDLAAARHRIEEIPWVRTAVVERRLPGQIHLLITERSPIALWQNKGRYFLVDRDGQIVGDQIDDYSDLPLTVGEGAPDHAGQLVALLQSEPSLRGRVKAATWIGDRRWNVMLDRTPDGIEVRLPEDTAEAAWHDLARLEAEQSVLERQISVVDMRLPDRLVLRAATSGHEQAAGAKRKTSNGKDA
jgi:cell division protein FtsQ